MSKSALTMVSNSSEMKIELEKRMVRSVVAAGER